MDFGILLKTKAKKIGKNLSGKYSQKPLDRAKQSATDAYKTVLKRAMQKDSLSNW